MRKLIFGLVLGAVGLSAMLFSSEIIRVTTAWAANAACQIENCQEQGGSRWSVGGSLDILASGDLDIESGGALKLAGVTITASAVELNQAADNSANVEVVAATNVITAAESGATFFLNDATEFVSTLPLPVAGLRYKFIISAAPSGANYTIVTAASANIITVMLDALTADDLGDFAAARDVITFVGGVSIVGDWVECISDGTSWFCSGAASLTESITTGQSG